MKRLIAIVVAFVALATVYSIVVPLWEAPDETEHFPAIRFIAEEHRLPDSHLPSVQGTGGSAYQPPLYYLVVAPAAAVADTSGYARLRQNPDINQPDSPWVKAIVYHTEDESFPYRDLALAVHLGRLFSVVFGAGVVVATYLLARQVFAQDKGVAVAAAAIGAFTPQFLFLSGALNNGNLLSLLASVLLVVLAAWVNRGRSLVWAGVVGLLLGLSLLTKYNAFALVPVVAFAIALRAWRERSARRFAAETATVAVVAIAVSAWWFVDNASRYGNPFYRQAVPSADTPAQVVATLASDYPLNALGTTFASYWAYFGWTNITVHHEIYWALAALTALGVIGVLRGPRSSSRFGLGVLIVAVASVVAVVATRSLMTQGTGTDSGRFLFPMIAAFSVLLAAGLRRIHHRLPWVAAVGLLALAAISPFVYIAPAYPAPLPVRTNVATATIPSYAPAAFSNGVSLLGHDIAPRRLRPGESARLTLFWGVDEAPSEDWIAFVHLLNRSGDSAAGDDRLPLEDVYPMRRWQTGEVVREERTLDIEADAAPGVYALNVGFYRYPSLQRATVRGGSADSIDVGRITVVAAAATPQHSLRACFEGGPCLIGYDLSVVSRTATATLYWQAAADIADDFTVFVHLVDDRGRLVTQHDGAPAQGNYPTSAWRNGDHIPDSHRLALPPGAASGDYELWVGLYRSTGARLPLVEGDRDSLRLQSVRIE